jgi:DNA-binding transcriptional LysR family regulator
MPSPWNGRALDRIPPREDDPAQLRGGLSGALQRHRGSPEQSPASAAAPSRLEATSGVRLMYCITHGFSLTDEGDAFLAQARRMLDISADDRIIDIAREGIDVAIRTGAPSSDTVVARQIGVLTRSLACLNGRAQ